MTTQTIDFTTHFAVLYAHPACDAKGCNHCQNGAVVVAVPRNTLLEDVPTERYGGRRINWEFSQAGVDYVTTEWTMRSVRQRWAAERGAALYNAWYESLTDEQQSDVEEMHSQQERYRYG